MPSRPLTTSPTPSASSLSSYTCSSSSSRTRSPSPISSLDHSPASPPPAYFSPWNKLGSTPPPTPLLPTYNPNPPSTPPPGYLPRHIYTHRLSSHLHNINLLEATVQDVRAQYFIPQVAPQTVKMTLDELYNVVDVAAHRHSLTLEETLEAREIVRKEWCELVGKRMSKWRNAWVVGGILLTALAISLSATLIKH